MKNEDCDFVAYEKLVDLAKINNLNLEIHSIDSFRNGLLEECKRGISHDVAAPIVSDNLKKDTFYYDSFIDKIRRPKIFGMAIFDWALTVLGILFIIAYFGLTGIGAVLASIGAVAFGVGVHKYLDINTQFGYYLGLNPRLR